MDTISGIFLSWQFLLLSSVIALFVDRVGTIGSHKDSKGKRVGGVYNNIIWQLILPLLPAVVGAGLACIPGIPLPAALPVTWGAKILYGLSAGFACDKTYQTITNVKKTKDR